MKSIKLLTVSFLLIILACNNSGKVRYAEIETEFGTMKLELYNSTPIHRDNFIKLANDGFYDGLLFHRVMQGFMIQGGDPDSRTAVENQRLGMGGPGYTLPNEIGSPHFKGALAAARLGGPSNPEKESSGSQFYIVQGQVQNEQTLSSFEQSKGIQYNESQRSKYLTIGGTPALDMEYTVFGELVEGFDVLDKIAEVQTDGADRPLENITMQIRMAN